MRPRVSRATAVALALAGLPMVAPAFVAPTFAQLLAPGAPPAPPAARRPAFASRVYSNEPVVPILPPTNPLPPEKDSANVTRFSFIVYGDTRGRQGGKQEQYEHSLVIGSAIATVKKMEMTPFPVKFFIMTGDAVIDGRDPQTWNVGFASVINRVTQQAGLPIFMSPGNHDVGSSDFSADSPGLASEEQGPRSQDAANRGPGIRNYLTAVSKLLPPDNSSRRLPGYPTYAFAHGNLFAVGIDSNIANDAVQFDWVSKQLAGLDRRRYKHVIAFFHHPLYSSGPHGFRPEPPTLSMRDRYAPLFRKHNVSLLLTGHEHLYEHWVERYERAGKQHRIDQVVTGGGGAPLYGFNGRPDLREYLLSAPGRADHVVVQQLVRPGVEAGSTPFHYVIIQVDGDHLRLEVVGVDWGADFRPYHSRSAALEDELTVIPAPPAQDLPDGFGGFGVRRFRRPDGGVPPPAASAR